MNIWSLHGGPKRHTDHTDHTDSNVDCPPILNFFGRQFHVRYEQKLEVPPSGKQSQFAENHHSPF